MSQYYSAAAGGGLSPYGMPRADDSLGPAAASLPISQPAEEYRPAEPKAVSLLRRSLTPKTVILAAGLLVLSMLCIVPVWNATTLLHDANYVFWVGKSVPVAMLLICLVILVLYAATVLVFFSYTTTQVQTEQTIMAIATAFITLLGLALTLVSMPLWNQATLTSTNLMSNCMTSPQTHRLYEYSEVLQNIRAMPSCAPQVSVETCAGYEDTPYTRFLKSLENNFHCSGFCFQQIGAEKKALRYVLRGSGPGDFYCGGAELLHAGSSTSQDECMDQCDHDGRCKFFSYSVTSSSHMCALSSGCATEERVPGQVIWIYEKQSNLTAPAGPAAEEGEEGQGDEEMTEEEEEEGYQAPAPAPTNAPTLQAALIARLNRRRKSSNRAAPVALIATDQATHTRTAVSATSRRAKELPGEPKPYPPTLFSDANYQASCDGMAARDMKNFAGDVASQTFCQGIYLVIICVVVGFLKICGFCIPRDASFKVM